LDYQLITLLSLVAAVVVAVVVVQVDFVQQLPQQAVVVL
jgi:hypothetical protein